MKKFKRFLSVLIPTLLIGMVLVGCQKDENEDESSRKEPVEAVVESDERVNDVELSDWDGSWNSIVYYLDDEEIQGAYEEISERENISIEEAKADYKTKVGTDFKLMEIDGKEISFLDGKRDQGGNEIERLSYEYKDKHSMEHGGQELFWYEFNALEESEYKVILLLDVHGEETMPHFHLRYGDDADDLMQREDWYPTLVKSTSTIDQIYEEIVD